MLYAIFGQSYTFSINIGYLPREITKKIGVWLLHL